MATIAEMKVDLRNWILTVFPTGNEAIWSKQGAPIPTGNFFVLTINNFKPYSWGYTDTSTDADGVQNISETSEFELEIDCYGNDAFSKLTDLQKSVLKPEILELFYAGDMAYVDVSPVQDTSTIYDNVWEIRANVSFRFRGQITTTTTPGYFDTVAVTVTAKLENEVKYTETFEI